MRSLRTGLSPGQSCLVSASGGLWGGVSLVKTKELISQLNEFLFLEQGQVALYQTMAAQAPDRHQQQGLLRLAAIEEDHVRNISGLLVTCGGRTSGLPAFMASQWGYWLSRMGLTALISGTRLLADWETVLQGAVLGEEQAISAYRQLLDRVRDPELQAVLWFNLIDEELHACWLEFCAAQRGKKTIVANIMVREPGQPAREAEKNE